MEKEEIKKILRDTIPPSSLSDFGPWYSYLDKTLKERGYRLKLLKLDMDGYKVDIVPIN
jgi:hypothetical protein